MQETVLITGCSSGIGRASALAFLEEGWTVYATARNPADVQTLGEAGCEIATLDVTDDSDVDRVVDRILDAEGSIDCLVNNAGYGRFGPIEDVPIEDVHEQFDVNVYGPHRLARAVLPSMRRERDGTIINVSSVFGRISMPGTGVYAGSKHALEAMSDALRNELAEYDVDVVVVEPGSVRTGFSERAGHEIPPDDEPGDSDRDDVRSGAYEEFYRVFEDTQLVAGDGPGSVEPEAVATEILNVASMTRPPARVQPGTLPRVAVLARHLPDGMRDAAYDLLRKLSR
ncbi:SDR family oxidoreductase [Halopenitus sp. H-Gu1]|uniref:SDR family oxidoreductase n=1 Tax=Halopenitus sp. H-Gu1 TaxID=3242697 RepID=UPI00359D2851